MKLHELKPAKGSRRPRKRVGRGPGSGHGKTAGRGHKGLYSRSGASRRLGYEGGQMALARRIAKRGFSNNQFAPVVAILSLSTLEKYFEAGDEVTPDVLRDRGIVKGNYDVLKVLANGKLSKKLTVKAHRFSQAAEEAITKAGGIAERILS